MTIVHDDRSKNSANGCYICRSTTTSLEKTTWGVYPHWYRLRINGLDRHVCNTCFVRYKNVDNRNSIKVCVECGSTTTSMEKTEWGIYSHWYGTFERPVCKRCYVRRKWQEKYVPKDAKCDRCRRSTSVVSKYGTPIWVRDKKRKDVVYCKGCFVIIRDTGQMRPQEARKNIGIGIHKALDKGIIPRKSLVARVIGLENNRHFWRGVFDGDGYFKNKDGKDGDRMVLTGSNDLCAQFGEFIKKNIPDARITIKRIRDFSKLYIYSDTARAVAKLLYSDCEVALKRKLVKARRMFGW